MHVSEVLDKVIFAFEASVILSVTSIMRTTKKGRWTQERVAMFVLDVPLERDNGSTTKCALFLGSIGALVVSMKS